MTISFILYTNSFNRDIYLDFFIIIILLFIILIN